ncbi:hypothetical protein EVAR_48479_1 [Eumeta japonica]|uniref:Uncharacterized protein n=1 Tax=Eumeta variegata TaxID=151549 RepID=A0A4C1XEJ9_EUMVA|nr:hypothetical protein EVAR_48479_1 [Eumeta japonica]
MCAGVGRKRGGRRQAGGRRARPECLAQKSKLREGSMRSGFAQVRKVGRVRCGPPPPPLPAAAAPLAPRRTFNYSSRPNGTLRITETATAQKINVVLD